MQYKNLCYGSRADTSLHDLIVSFLKFRKGEAVSSKPDPTHLLVLGVPLQRIKLRVVIHVVALGRKHRELKTSLIAACDTVSSRQG